MGLLSVMFFVVLGVSRDLLKAFMSKISAHKIAKGSVEGGQKVSKIIACIKLFPKSRKHHKL